MEYLRIKKGDNGIYAVTLKNERVQEFAPQPNSKWPKKEYGYAVNTRDGDRILVASETLHKRLQAYKPGDMIELQLVVDGDKSQWVVEKIIQQQSAPAPVPAPASAPAAPQYAPQSAPAEKEPSYADLQRERDIRIEHAMYEKHADIHVQSALNMALKRREVSQDDNGDLAGSAIWFLEMIEGGLRAEQKKRKETQAAA